MTATFSPRVTSAENGWTTSLPPYRFAIASSVSVCFPDGAFCSNLMNGAAMFDRFMSSSLSFCIARMRLCTCEARVPAWKRATKSRSCSTFFFFSSFSDSTRERTWPLFRTMSS